MASSAVSSLSVLKATVDSSHTVTDLVAVEEPLEIMVQYGPSQARKEGNLAITMRTPGHDFELVTGFLLSEGIIKEPHDIISIQHCHSKEAEKGDNTVKVQLQEQVSLPWDLHKRHVYVSSSCGICGKTSMEAVKTSCRWSKPGKGPQVDPQIIRSLPGILSKHQLVFNRTGGLHASVLFNEAGELLMLREDVGRHNALDKLLGAAFYSRLLPLDQHILLVSGRVSFELVQKAVMAGVRFMAAIGAPSSLAVDLAAEFDMTLLGFVSKERFNVYNGWGRINNHKKLDFYENQD